LDEISPDYPIEWNEGINTWRSAIIHAGREGWKEVGREGVV